MDLNKENIKRIWLTEDAIHIETTEGKEGKEFFSDYPRLNKVAQNQRENYKITPFGIRWVELDEDLSFNGFFKEKKKSNDFSKVFNRLNEINISAFARRVGVAQPLMAAYLSGAKVPSKKRKKEIEKELHSIGKELMEISL